MGLGIGLIILAGCHGITDQEHLEKRAQPSPAASSTLVQMQSSDVIPAEETAIVEYDEKARQALKETLNLTFQIINAMQENDYAYIKSVSAKDVQIDAEDHTVIVDHHQRAFLKDINLGNLEYRFYFPRNPNQIELGFTIINHNEISGYDIVFEYIRGSDGQWLYHGHLIK